MEGRRGKGKEKGRKRGEGGKRGGCYSILTLKGTVLRYGGYYILMSFSIALNPNP